ncbi:hypothetical protein GALMADRAFT_146924 [Galerina marginata CBS 339.88]|uniref:G-protein coupled receptors family 1 profile domain-containing protein n=1 Tax=Galerina marginata (strain CBS 339.88) TaxID=685588 RepID=A0A067SLJ0_GALM3|nr:hypothetical protein GALMADRAFT_146924 [Galerina marginata CBS 339.88]
MSNALRLDLIRIIGIVLEGLFYGIFLTLLYDLTVILVERAKERRRGIFRQPTFPTSLSLLVVITGHLVCSTIEVSTAFVLPRDVSYCLQPGDTTPAEKYFLAVHNPFNISSAAFFIATLLIGEWFLIYRLYFVWERNIYVTIPSGLLSLGVLACGISVTYLFSQDAPVFKDNRLITPTWSLTLASNLYSTAMISFKLIFFGPCNHVIGIRKTVLEVLVQSAAILSLLGVFLMAFILSKSNMVYITTSLTAPVVGINFCLIVIRTHSRKPDVYLIESVGEGIEFTAETATLPTANHLVV